MDQYKQQTHKWMVIQPIELKHPTIKVANKPTEISIRIRICELICVTGHLDTHLDAHADHMFLTDNRISGYICGKTEVKRKIPEHGFFAE